MLKKRLIFILFFNDGYFHLSRNFVLQKVGDVDWLLDKFRFIEIGKYIDELILLDVTRNPGLESEKLLEEAVKTLMKKVLVPLSIGGRLNSIEKVSRCFQIGADKVVLNTSLFVDPFLAISCVEKFGSQAVVASIDVKEDQGNYNCFSHNGSVKQFKLSEHLKKIVEIKPGELFVQSVNKNGTGTGLDLILAKKLFQVPMPLIIAGGAGKPEHFKSALQFDHISAVATGNLFNFIGDGFKQARDHLVSSGCRVRNYR